MEEIEKKAEELVKLSLQAKELREKIADLKAEIMEYCEQEHLNDKVWSADNGYVELKTETKYKLADIPADFKVDSQLNIATDISEKAFKVKIALTKEGKKLFLEKHPSIVNLMIPSIKKSIKVSI